MRSSALGAVLAILATACGQAAGPAAPSAPPPPVAESPTPTAATPSPTLAPSVASCGQKITQRFLLANDLNCPKDGLIVDADGVTLDLGGRTLTGPGIGEQTWPQPNLSSVGVKVQGHGNVTVRNGTISGFATNVLFDAVSGAVLEDLTSVRSRYGAYLNNTHNSTVRRTNMNANIYGLHLQKSSDNRVEDNVLARQTYNSPGGYGLYIFSAQRNRIVGNTIEANLNWGIWLSDAKENVFFHNNVLENSPQVSDNTGQNTWHDAEKKQGNWWADYGGIDRDGDGIGDSPYVIGGPGNQVDPYPFIQRDGWKKKAVPTVDHYQPPVAKERRDVRLVALAGGAVVSVGPAEKSAAPTTVRGSSLALSTDQRTMYVLSESSLSVVDAITGEQRGRFSVDISGMVAANRDGRRAIVVGPQGAVQVNVQTGVTERFKYRDHARDVAPSWKHNILFVSTGEGIDIFYMGSVHGGNVPYTIPLDGPGGALAMNRSGTRIYAVAQGSSYVDVVDTEQYMVVDRLRVPWEPVALAVAPDGGVLYAAARESVLAIDLASGQVRSTGQFTGTPVDIAVSPNGDEVYVAVEGAPSGISVLRTDELRETHFIRIEGTSPPARLLVATY